MRRVWPAAALTGGLALSWLACVGDDPAILPSNADASAPIPPNDGGTPPLDSGTDSSGDAEAAAAPKVVHLAAGGYHTCALLSDGHVKCWGVNARGEIGSGAFSDSEVLPRVVSTIDDAAGIGGGANHTCIVTRTSTVKCWGDNFYGALGIGTVAALDGGHASTPVDVPGLTNIASIPSVNNATTCAITKPPNPTAYCWGVDGFFQTGSVASVLACVGLSGTSDCQPSPLVVQGGISVESIGSGSAHTCVSYGNSAVRCWGIAAGGRLGGGVDGDGSTVTTSPVVVSGFAADELAAGSAHTCARKGGAVSCWGANTFGASGQGNDSTIYTSAPTTVQLPGPGAAKQISARNFNTCALLTDGTVACWGANDGKQLGSATNVVDGCVGNPQAARNCRATAELVSGLTGVTEIAVGSTHACALLASGAVRCWGSNSNGQIGDGNKGVAVVSPVDVKL